MLPRIISLLLLASSSSPSCLVVNAQKSSAPATTSSSGNAKPLQFSSPIQSYTIFDKSALSSPDYVSPRQKFLPRFRTGLMAEKRAKEVLMDEQRSGIIFDDDDDDDLDESSTGSWAEASAAADERKKKATEKRVEAAYDAAVKGYDGRVSARALKASSSPAAIAAASSSSAKYQFVGVVHDGKSGSGVEKKDGVTWYARKKPRGSNWNVRLVHVNRDAVLRDLFIKGKIDVFSKYTNKGIDKAAFAAAETSGEDVEGEDKKPGMKPLIKAQYTVKERSWKTMWNFSMRRFFTTSSGSFWRERRINPGLYTDGTTVYESVYRYRDGKNGMKPVAKLSNFLASPGLGYEEKMRVVDRLKGGDDPDVVVEN
mmetsp:Transcript_947/g.2038  ORF Transcript_947/g.2038 Transcript_947/m.2038 type:complete len:369 (-) Transcript_947:76-1182(-)